MTASAGTAEAITRASKSNLALAFVALPAERRRDISVFYAFCRLVDDLADEPDPPLPERRRELQRWREAVCRPVEAESPLAPAVRELIAKYHLDTEHFSEIIAGCEMDLDGVRFETWEELRIYCYRVASVVGLVSIEIFGCSDPRCRQYAIDLGLALQVTNILRDVAEDYARDGRVYLPRRDMEACGYPETDLAAGRYNAAFISLMQMEAQRAHEHFARAVASLPRAEQRKLVAAEIMRGIYGRILARMERDRFRVFQKRYRLGKLTKVAVILGTLLRGFLVR